MSDKSSSQALKDFVSETEEIIESLNLDMVRLADSVDSGDCDPDVLNGIFRGAHSIKGLSGMFGFDDLSTLSHSMESLLDGLRLGKIPFNQYLVDTLFASLDLLIKLIDGKSNDENFPLDLTPVLDQISKAAEGGGDSDANPLDGLEIDPDSFEKHHGSRFSLKKIKIRSTRWRPEVRPPFPPLAWAPAGNI